MKIHIKRWLKVFIISFICLISNTNKARGGDFGSFLMGIGAFVGLSCFLQEPESKEQKKQRQQFELFQLGVSVYTEKKPFLAFLPSKLVCKKKNINKTKNKNTNKKVSTKNDCTYSRSDCFGFGFAAVGVGVILYGTYKGGKYLYSLCKNSLYKKSSSSKNMLLKN